jgi:hypothetical protein
MLAKALSGRSGRNEIQFLNDPLYSPNKLSRRPSELQLGFNED